ncbi:winged helix-turn-helix domain-containing protein [Streptomyces marispadix]|uniref:winged helix-turn-helix domain-containing protein n=1 Tax=Streptomyces marispadix TaxID=2922868 RepID=UPI0027E3AA0F|nr:transcriptional regulator [Streptomyces marispadix]
MTHADLDPVLLDPTRLSIVSLLAATEWAEFGWVRDAVGMSDSALSKQVTTLGKQGYVEVEKGYVGKRPRTWLNLSEDGRTALEDHVSALQRIVEQSRQAGEAHVADGHTDDADDAAQGTRERGATGQSATGQGAAGTARSPSSARRPVRRSPPPASA